MMNYELATDEQLFNIINHDKDCPTSLVGGVALEMIQRNLWNDIIMYAGKQAFIHLNYSIQLLNLTHQELIHIGHIEIVRVIEKFKTGMRTIKTYIIMCLISKFKKMIREANAEKRAANLKAEDVTEIDESFFRSPINVEQYVINKLTIESCWGVLREVEKKAILLEQEGYSQYEIADMLGMRKTYGNVLLKRAYEKLRRELGA